MAYKVEKVNPYHPDQPKKEQVIRMFNKIAPTYDRLNGTLSLGIDDYWRSDALKELRKYPHKQLLDIATGTGDFAILAQKILQPEKISAVDISEGMMNVGKEKVKAKGLQDIITFEVQDCADMTFPDNSFDAATIAFGVRNFEDIDKSFQEILRILKPGGVFLFIELTTPQTTPMKQLYATYTKYVMPVLSGIFATEQKAYTYLPESIAAFPQGREMMLILKKNGFANIRLRRYTLGITTLYIAEKPI
ncbi:bifunctional demethylmenaquinone methyltransferase/2-methoxy-6-polyprenyl-1,4-benzoquinol methylase UbiE [uncultured Proteiniphilum sp.]|uniref:bifunctional demethylmenaquinone methyltransferase/2-methoxy-6-polyprenyl-1,4-benzoquinol methylase UbiE n=1 Tax=uncultured Proteiniphilum sp. TaxID=497637 RepID=UPI002614FE10|nr:bifunctional demethylmenaquinone methyltransferase/2-methoxy-6-polyprenyl-1,4-benzoquinol methylase UbiE [uncultured Proteiniphilum sp.]